MVALDLLLLPNPFQICYLKIRIRISYFPINFAREHIKGYTTEYVGFFIKDDVFFFQQTANNIAFLLCDLAQNPDKQQKLYAEIDRVLGKCKKVKKSHLANMSYLKACVKETQR